jgi:hypothetical protein
MSHRASIIVVLGLLGWGCGFVLVSDALDWLARRKL